MKNSGKQKTGKFVISSILSFLIAVLCTMLGVLAGGYLGFFGTSHIFNSMEKESYYSETLKYFTENAEDISIPVGVPKEALQGIVSIGNVKTDVEGYLSGMLDGSGYEFDTELLKSKLAENVKQVFQEADIKMSKEQKEAIPKYTEQIAAEYVKDVKFPAAAYIGKAKDIYKSVMIIGIPICILLTGIAVFILIRLYYWKHRGVRFIVYALLGTGIMTVIVPGTLLFTKGYEKLNIAPEYFKNFAIRYIEGSLLTFIYIGIFWFVTAVLLLGMIHFMKEKVKK